MRVCPACGKKYPDEANFCARAACAAGGQPRQLVAAAVVIPEGAKRNVLDFPRKPAADDPPERVRALAEEPRRIRRKTRIGHSPAPVGPPITRSDRFQFDAYFEARKPTADKSESALTAMTPTQLALYLSGLLKAAGVVDVSSWPITGAGGADLLFSWHGKKVVVSTKNRTEAASSRAAKNALQARDAYGGQAVWLLTTARFKPAVHALANEPQLLVVDGEKIGDLESIVTRQLRLLETAKTRRNY